MMILAPIAAGLIQMAISRSREFEADAGGARICGNPHWLANALIKLETSEPSAVFYRSRSASSNSASIYR